MWRRVLGQIAFQRDRRLIDSSWARPKAALSVCPRQKLNPKYGGPRNFVKNSSGSEESGGQRKKRFRFDQVKIFVPGILSAAIAVKNDEKESETAILNPEQHKQISELLKKGRHMLETKCRMEKVEEVYTEALHIALETKHKSTIAFVQDQLANLALQNGKLNEAEKLFRNVVRNLLDSGMKETDVTILEISLKLATIYASGKDDELAVTGYKWVIEKCRENLKNLESVSKSDNNEYKNQLALLGMSLDSYGRYLYMRGDNKKALDVTKEAHEVSIELFSENDIRTLILLNDVGAILSSMGEYDEAVKIIKKAINTADKCAHTDSADVAIFWLNLSGIYAKMQDKDKAFIAFKNARKKAELSSDSKLIQKVERIIKQISDEMT